MIVLQKCDKYIKKLYQSVIALIIKLETYIDEFI